MDDYCVEMIVPFFVRASTVLEKLIDRNFDSLEVTLITVSDESRKRFAELVELQNKKKKGILIYEKKNGKIKKN